MRHIYEEVIKNFDFLSPAELEHDVVSLCQIEDDNILARYEVEQPYTVRATMETVQLEHHRFFEDYARLQLEKEIIDQYYNLIRTKADSTELSTLNITSLDNDHDAATKIVYEIMKQFTYRKTDAELPSYIIISPFIYTYFYNSSHLIMNPQSRLNSYRSRIKKVGVVQGQIDVYVDFEAKDDFIIIGSNPNVSFPGNIQLLYKMYDNEPLHMALKVVNSANLATFKRNFHIIKDVKNLDPMERDCSKFSALDFFKK